jgi:Rrf2 family protein
MRLSSATVYAVRALAYLTRHGGEGPVPSHVIEEAEGLSERSLVQALTSLVGARVLHSLRGHRGGYRLAKPTEAITLLDIVEAVDGPLRGEALPVGGTAEGKRFDKQLQAVCDMAAELTRQQLRRLSLADLAGE